MEAGLVAAIGTEASCLMQFNFLQKKNADRPKVKPVVVMAARVVSVVIVLLFLS